ncbi:hypothetical protein [Paraferrimonas sedimenticola]|uniref:Uncharacterized protein n=1 Tax=Paraferrimonas sedimenticola TaxID=375674 RepID=A0AA37RWI0_9GAMM|nr:hypothetical protein [Paraferrimonas sedimenticola]GLP97010.1 hypothetical protein GCM10007895_23160 [Paraferrimonas sedimenticola]
MKELDQLLSQELAPIEDHGFSQRVVTRIQVRQQTTRWGMATIALISCFSALFWLPLGQWATLLSGSLSRLSEALTLAMPKYLGVSQTGVAESLTSSMSVSWLSWLVAILAVAACFALKTSDESSL